MLFNSTDFFIFLPFVFLLYWFVFKNNVTGQNLFLVVASYVFYGWWDWRFLTLIFVSSLADFIIGKYLDKQDKDRFRRLLLILSISINISVLGVFKYFNFFNESFAEIVRFFGMEPNPFTLKIILPVGISFYTFQTLSYTIDIYRRRITPTQDPIAFFAFVSFFPQLVAGPIERAKSLLPQFLKPRTFNINMASDGLKQMLWGFFKKIVIADNTAKLVQIVFDNPGEQSGIMLVLGAVFFSFQVYCDFSGYSDIAIGTAKLFGFRLMDNFMYPFFSRNIGELWRRWHISLTTWFRDYIYIPLGGSRGGKWTKVRNIVLVFTISGLWHGAAWTYVIWGFISGLLFIPEIITGANRKYLNLPGEGRLFPSLKEFWHILITFSIFTATLILFRSHSVHDAIIYFKSFFLNNFYTNVRPEYLLPIVFIALMLIVEWVYREQSYPLALISSHRIVRWATYSFILVLIFSFGEFNQTEFIYFQF